MAKASVSLNAVRVAGKLVQELRESLQESIARLLNGLVSLDDSWQDEKRVRLEEIVGECIDSLQKLIRRCEECEETLREIEAAIVEYESVILEGAGEAASGVSGVDVGLGGGLSMQTGSSQGAESQGALGVLPGTAGDPSNYDDESPNSASSAVDGVGSRESHDDASHAEGDAYDNQRGPYVGATTSVPIDSSGSQPGQGHTSGISRNAGGRPRVMVPRRRSRRREGPPPRDPGVTPGYGPERAPEEWQRRNAMGRASDEELTRRIDPLPQTNEEKVTLSNRGTRYDRPDEQHRRLNWRQGLAIEGFTGDCGVCAVQNVALMAGKSLSERDVLQLAIDENLCTTGSTNPGNNGGTRPIRRKKLLELLGIQSDIDMNHSVRHIADLVESGRGVIVSVEVSAFWPRDRLQHDSGLHAVTITSVERNAVGTPTVFHCCDSGLHDPDFAVSASNLLNAMPSERGMNVTSIIR